MFHKKNQQTVVWLFLLVTSVCIAVADVDSTPYLRLGTGAVPWAWLGLLPPSRWGECNSFKSGGFDQCQGSYIYLSNTATIF